MGARLMAIVAEGDRGRVYLSPTAEMEAIALSAQPQAVQPLLVHTGQHYDAAMSDQLFVGLGMRAPDINLDVGSGTHAVQTAEVMRRFEPVVDTTHPSCVVVVGDVNSTLACTLVAVKKNIPVAHVEAGLRSFDRTMPEEINRLLTDQVADLLYTTERSAAENLRREGIPAEKVHFVGNLMIDSLAASREHAIPPSVVLARNGVDVSFLQGNSGFGVVTLHRPSNVDRREDLAESLAILREVSAQIPLICLLHPRTRGNIDRFGLAGLVDTPGLVVLPPQGYLETVGLMTASTLVITDSGGMQEETTGLGVPCLTMRENTERPITVDQGTNVLVGRNRVLIRECVSAILSGGGKRGRTPELWDGCASPRIATHLASWLVDRAESAAR